MKGVLILVGIIVVSAVMCGVVPYFLMPEVLGTGMALPVITVPGEVLWKDFLGLGFEMTNTIIGTLIADVIVLAFAFGATRRLKEVPGRLQGMFEVMTDALYGLTKSTADRNARQIFPLMATIFLFLLVANWIKLVPGAESIGLMHCAHEGIGGYPRDGAILQTDTDTLFDKGTRATEHNYELCHDKEEGHAHEGAHAVVMHAVEAAIGAEMALDDFDFRAYLANEQAPAEYIAAEGGDLDAIIAAAVERLPEMLDEAVEADELTADEADEVLAHPDEAVVEVINEPYYYDNIYAVTPFVRGATTDLNLTLALAVLAVIAIQYFGVQALGFSYFTKFLNTPALESMSERPMGAMDFIVGLLEIISEISKIISFAFRLFGTLFAGGVLLFVVSFLTPMLVPSAVYVLELFVGLIQAFVFAMLTMVFASIATIPHGHDDEHH